MRTVCTWTVVTLTIVLIPAVALAQSQTRPGPHAASYNRHLEIGPVPGLTTTWHPAPAETAAPLGATLSFRVTSGRGASVEWTGARLMERRHGTSTAECYLATPGPHTVTIEYTDAAGERRQESSRLNVIDTSVFPITFSRPRLWAEPVVLDARATNEDTMRYYFGDSIAAVRELGEGRYLTSTNRWFHLEVDVEPAGFAPLVEWRLNGVAQRHLGTGIRMQVFAAREHTIRVGTAESPQEISLQTYMVHITSHEPRVADIPEYSPVTFTAMTDPPGYEGEITWLASTKYGSCGPLMGHGPEFTVTFRDTVRGDGQWLGVKADQVRTGQDKKEDDGEISCSIAEGECEIRSRDERCRTTRVSIQHPDPHNSSIQFRSFGPFHSFDLTAPLAVPGDTCENDCGVTCAGFTCNTHTWGCTAVIAVECCGTNCSETCEILDIEECPDTDEPPPVGP